MTVTVTDALEITDAPLISDQELLGQAIQGDVDLTDSDSDSDSSGGLVPDSEDELMPDDEIPLILSYPWERDPITLRRRPRPTPKPSPTGDFVQLVGDDGNNVLAGSGESHAIFGLAGDDVLTGGSFTDILVGGVGADVFVLNDSTSVDDIDDFIWAEGDRIRIVASAFDVEMDDFSRFDIDVESRSLQLDGTVVATFSDATNLSGDIPAMEEVLEIVESAF